MSSKKKPKKNSDSTFNFINSTVEQSAVGPSATVNITQLIDSEKLKAFSLKFDELKSEINHLSGEMSQEDVFKVDKEVKVVETQIQRQDKLDGQIILNSLKEISTILTKFSITGMILKQLFDMAQPLFAR